MLAAGAYPPGQCYVAMKMHGTRQTRKWRFEAMRDALAVEVGRSKAELEGLRSDKKRSTRRVNLQSVSDQQNLDGYATLRRR